MMGGCHFSPLKAASRDVSPAAWIAPTATLVGDVRVEAEASVWYGAVLRADFGPILVRRGANIQDGSVLHGGDDPVTEVGEGATVGHLCVVHGAVIGAEALVGNGATVLDGARVGRRALVAAGATVPPGMVVPDGMLAAGVPARVTGRSPGRPGSGWRRTPPSTASWPGGTRPERPRPCHARYRLGRVGTMEYRALGQSGLRVSVLTMGTMTFGGRGAFASVGSTDVAQASRQVDMCLDAGVNLIDTADVYSGGLAEEILGQVLHGPPGPGAAGHQGPDADGPRAERRRALPPPRHHRLRGQPAPPRHRPHRPVPGARVGRPDPARGDPAALDLLVQSGKVRYVGRLQLRLLAADEGAGHGRAPGPAAVRQPADLLLPEAREAEYELIPLAVDQGLGVLVWSPLAGGLLSGKYRRGHEAPAGSRQLTDWGEPPVYDQEGLYDTIEVLVKIAEQRGVSAAQVALAYTLAKPAVTSLVIGARTDEQLADNLAAASLALSDDERAQLDKASAPPLIYPYWHQAKTARDRLSPADLTLLAPHLQ